VGIRAGVRYEARFVHLQQGRKKGQGEERYGVVGGVCFSAPLLLSQNMFRGELTCD